MTALDARPPRRRLRRVLVPLAVLAVAVALAGTALATTSSGGSRYRTATVRRSSVVESLSRTGTITPVAQAFATFPISGTVATVDVRVGDAVSTGQTLATLDVTSLESAVASSQATLAATRLTLQQALDAEAAPATSTAPVSAAVAPTASSAPAAAGRGSGGGSQLEAGQRELAQAQQHADAALAAATESVNRAATVCPAPGMTPPTTGGSGPGLGAGAGSGHHGPPPTTTPSSTTSTTTPSPATTSTTAPTTSTTAPPPDGGPAPTPASCESALRQALGDEQTALAAEHDVQQTETTFAQQLSTAAQGASGARSGAASGGARSGTSAAAATSASRSSTAAKPTAADLVADQASVDAAAAAVAAAQQSLDAATLVSPFAGHVAAVTLAPERQVSAGSSTAYVIVVGQAGWEVDTTVLATDVSLVKVGAPATVTPDGSGRALAGSVVAIGVTPNGSTAPTYPVVIGFTKPPSGLWNGGAAAVTIQLAQSRSVLAVPTSAVHSLGNRRFVTVLSGGRTTQVPIETGAVGADLTEVRSGLEAGQVVVLADIRQPIPTSSAASRIANRITGGGGGLGGGGGGLGGGGVRGGGGGGRAGGGG